MLSMGKILGKFHLYDFGPLARSTGPKHGKNEKVLDFHECHFQGDAKHVKYGKNTQKKTSLLFRPVGPFDWAKTWKK